MNCRTGWVSNEFGNEKRILPFRTQRRAGIIYHACRATDVIGNGRNNVGSLPFEPGLEHFFIHPDLVGVIIRITIFSKLPVGAPAGVVPVDDVRSEEHTYVLQTLMRS